MEKVKSYNTFLDRVEGMLGRVLTKNESRVLFWLWDEKEALDTEWDITPLLESLSKIRRY